MLNRQTLSVVALSDMLRHMEFRSEEIEAIMDFGFNSVTFGDASYTLIPAWAAIDRIWLGLEEYYNELEDMAEDGTPSRSIPAKIYTEQEIRITLRKLVNQNDYVDLEG
jgi:hypothetical protein